LRLRVAVCHVCSLPRDSILPRLCKAVIDRGDPRVRKRSTFVTNCRSRIRNPPRGLLELVHLSVPLTACVHCYVSRRKPRHVRKQAELAARFLEPDRHAVPGRLQRQWAEILRYFPNFGNQPDSFSKGLACLCS